MNGVHMYVVLLYLKKKRLVVYPQLNLNLGIMDE